MAQESRGAPAEASHRIRKPADSQWASRTWKSPCRAPRSRISRDPAGCCHGRQPARIRRAEAIASCQYGITRSTVSLRLPIGVVAEERRPALRWGSPVPCHVFGDRGLTNIDAKLEEFSMDPGSAPTAGWPGTWRGSHEPAFGDEVDIDIVDARHPFFA